jgi:hypothetical protein
VKLEEGCNCHDFQKARMLGIRPAMKLFSVPGNLLQDVYSVGTNRMDYSGMQSDLCLRAGRILKVEPRSWTRNNRAAEMLILGSISEVYCAKAIHLLC